MKRLKFFTKASGATAAKELISKLLSFRGEKKNDSWEESPACIGKISPDMLREVLGEWLWLHNPSIQWGIPRL